MARVTIPVTANLKRVDGVMAQPSEIASIDAFLSIDGGLNFSKLPSLPGDATEIVIDGMDPGTTGIVEVSESDTQKPPAVSAKSSTPFSVPLPRLADPGAPILGTPVIS